MSITAPLELTATRVQDVNVEKKYGFQYVASLRHSHKVKAASGSIVVPTTSAATSATSASASASSSASSSASASASSLSVSKAAALAAARRNASAEDAWVVALDPRSLRLWRGGQETRRIVFPGGKSEILSAVLHIPEKGVVVAAAADLAFKLYEMHTLEYVESIALNQRAVYELKFLQSTQELVSAGVDGVTIWRWSERKTEVWDAQSKLWKSVTLHDLRVRVVFAGSGWARKMEVDEAQRRIYVLHESDVSVYDIDSGARRSVLSNLHKQPITCCVSYEASHYLVTGSAGGDICVWSDARENALVHTFRGRSKAITALCHHPTPVEAGLVVASSMDGTISVLSLDQLQERYRLNMRSGEGVSAMQVLANHHLLVTIGCTMELWKLQHLTTPLAPERAPIKMLRAIDAQSRILVHTADGSIRLVDVETGDTQCRVVPSSKLDTVRQVVLAAAEHRLYVLFSSSKVHVYDASRDPAPLVALWQHTKPHKDEIRVIALTSRYLVGGSAQGAIFFWDIRAGGELAHRIADAHEAAVTHLHVVPGRADGLTTTRLVSTGALADEAGICVWRVAGEEPLHDEAAHSDLGEHEIAFHGAVDFTGWAPISCVASSAEHALVFLGLESGEATLLDLRTMALVPGVSQDHAHEGRVTAAQFVDPLRLLVTAGEDGKLKVWDERKKLVRMLDMHGDPILALTALEDGLGDVLLGERHEVARIAAEDAYPARYDTLRKELQALARKEAEAANLAKRELLYEALEECGASVASELFDSTPETTDFARLDLLHRDLSAEATATAQSAATSRERIHAARFARRLASIEEETKVVGDTIQNDAREPGSARDAVAPVDDFVAGAAQSFVSVWSHAKERLAAARDLARTVVPALGSGEEAPQVFSPEALDLARERKTLRAGDDFDAGTSRARREEDDETDLRPARARRQQLIQVIDPATGLLRDCGAADGAADGARARRRGRGGAKAGRGKSRKRGRKKLRPKVHGLRAPTAADGTALRAAASLHSLQSSLSSCAGSWDPRGDLDRMMPRAPDGASPSTVRRSPRLAHLQAMLDASMDISTRPKGR